MAFPWDMQLCLVPIIVKSRQLSDAARPQRPVGPFTFMCRSFLSGLKARPEIKSRPMESGNPFALAKNIPETDSTDASGSILSKAGRSLKMLALLKLAAVVVVVAEDECGGVRCCWVALLLFAKASLPLFACTLFSLRFLVVPLGLPS